MALLVELSSKKNSFSSSVPQTKISTIVAHHRYGEVVANGLSAEISRFMTSRGRSYVGGDPKHPCGNRWIRRRQRGHDDRRVGQRSTSLSGPRQAGGRRNGQTGDQGD